MNYSIIRILSLSFAVTFFYVSGSLFAANLDNLPRDQARCTIDDLPRDPVQNQIVEYALTSKPYFRLTQWLIQRYSDIYGTRSTTPIATLPKKGDSAIISPDNSTLITVCDNNATIYRMSDLSSIAQLSHATEISSIAISPDSAKVITVSYDLKAKIWNIADGALINTIHGNGWGLFKPPFVVISPDGSKFITIFNETKIWNVSDGSFVGTISDHLNFSAISSIAITPDGSQVIAGLGDGRIKIFSMIDGSYIKTLPKEHKAAILSVEVSADGSKLATRDDGAIVLWNAAWDRHVLMPPANSLSNFFGTSAHGLYISAGYIQGFARIYNAADGSLVRTLHDRDDERIDLLRISHDGSSLIGRQPGVRHVKIWNIETGSLMGTIYHMPSVALTPNSSRIVTCALSGEVKIWNMPLFQLFEGLKKVSPRQLLLLDWLHEVQRKGYKANLNPNNIDLKMNPDPTKPDQEKQRRLINDYRAQYDSLPALIKELVHDFVLL